MNYVYIHFYKFFQFSNIIKLVVNCEKLTLNTFIFFMLIPNNMKTLPCNDIIYNHFI